MIKIIAEVEPVPFKRVRQNGKRRFNDSRYSCFKEALGFIARKSIQEPLTGAIKLHADIYKSSDKLTSRNWGDLDNFLKAILDALNGIAYRDDAQVVQISGSKKHGQPKIIIRLEELK